ncbi:MAG: hypothetical protein JNN30_17140 [Rhodanobacteraceae bacterium]|nr:hypothetical protein [Rhodanobacteraceae bacterium]
MLEFLFEIIGELLLQVVVETLAELGLRSLAEPLRRPPNPWLAALGYAVLGAGLGGLSLLLLPDHLAPSDTARIANLVFTPVIVGWCMVALGAWRAKRGESVLRIDRFSYGYLFALSLALVRFWFAQ